MEPAPSWGSYAKDESESVARRIELRLLVVLLVVLLLPLAKTCRMQMVSFSAVAHAVGRASLACGRVCRQFKLGKLMSVKDMFMHSGTWHSGTVFSADFAKIGACAGKPADLGQELDKTCEYVCKSFCKLK